MKRLNALPLVFGLSLVPLSSAVLAQAASSPVTRAEVKMDRAEFLKTHTWDASNEVWVLKPGVEAPGGMKSRAQIKSERDDFLAKNRWDEQKQQFVPMNESRDMSKLSRAEVKAETAAFLKMYRYDEVTEAWVPKIAPKKSK